MTLLHKKTTVAKSKEVKPGCSETNLAESFKEGYDSKRTVLPVMKTISLALIKLSVI
jgi:hypothetical protein